MEDFFLQEDEALVVEDVKPVVEEAPKPVVQAKKNDEKQNQKQINAAKAAALQILAKPKKQNLEKPVIRVYIPPVEESRPKRTERPQNPQFRDRNSNTNANAGMNAFQRQNTIEHLNNSPVLQKDTQKKKIFDNTPEEKTHLGKKAKLKKGLDGGGRAAVEYDDEGNVKKIRTRKTGASNKAQFNVTEAVVIEHAKVTIDTGWNNKKVSTRSDDKGNWATEISTPTYGGPFDIVVSDGEAKTLKNVYVGEVWLLLRLVLLSLEMLRLNFAAIPCCH